VYTLALALISISFAENISI